MKRTLSLIVALAIIALPLSMANAAEEAPWFDLENCEMCQPLMAEAGLMENMNWENHLFASGMMSVCAVKPEFEEAYQRANAKMMEVQNKLMSGEKANLCGLCKSMGQLMGAGAKVENIDTKAGHVMLVTSDKQELIAKIQKHGQTTIDEYAKMMQAMEEASKEAAKDPHAGHSHD